jgi:hypothetical protein
MNWYWRRKLDSLIRRVAIMEKNSHDMLVQSQFARVGAELKAIAADVEPSRTRAVVPIKGAEDENSRLRPVHEGMVGGEEGHPDRVPVSQDHHSRR